MQRMHTRRKIVILAVILAVFVILAAAVYFSLRRDIRFRMFRAMEHFSTESVNSPEYLLYDLDVTGLCRNYLNGDISVDGTIGLSRTEQLNIPLSVDIQGTRSVTQGRMHLEAGIRMLRYEAVSLDVYGENDMLYVDAPFLPSKGFALSTGVDIFTKAPETGRVLPDKEWFAQHRKQIRELIRKIAIEETGNTLEEERVSTEYRITIPEGSGDFLWELIGADPPKKDIIFTIYLTPDDRIRRLTLDLSPLMDGGTLMIDGIHADTAFFTRDLHEGKRLLLQVSRSREASHRLVFLVSYENGEKDSYEVSAGVEWTTDNSQESMDIRVRQLKIKRNGSFLGGGSFRGTLQTEDVLEDVFEGQEKRLRSLQKMNLLQIQDEALQYMDTVLDRFHLF